jgi:response regulator of citrate/malate metabolism
MATQINPETFMAVKKLLWEKYSQPTELEIAKKSGIAQTTVSRIASVVKMEINASKEPVK